MNHLETNVKSFSFLNNNNNFKPEDNFSFMTAEDTLINERKQVPSTQTKLFYGKSFIIDISQLQTNTEAILNIINNCLGADLLVSAFAMYKLGLIGSLVMLSVSAFVNQKTLILILRCCKECHTKYDFCSLAEYTFGKYGQVCVLLVQFLMGFFQMVSFLVACSQSISNLLLIYDDQASFTDQNWKLIAALICIPMTFTRYLKNVAIFSMIANISAIIMLVSMIIISSIKINNDGFQLNRVKLFPDNFIDLMSIIPILVITMSIQVGGVVIMSSLRDSSQTNIRWISYTSYLMIWCLQFIASIPYFAYLDDTKSNILVTFEPGILTHIARISCLILVIISQMFYIFPCRNAIIDLVFKEDESQFQTKTWKFYSVTIAINLSAVGVALCMKDLSQIFRFNGSVSANLVAFVLPCLFYMKMKIDHIGRPIFHKRNIFYILVIIIGVQTLCQGIINFK